MDIALIVGVVLGLGAIVGSMAIAFASGAAGSFANFIDVPSLGIVLGGMIASIFVAFPLPHVIALGKAIGAVLKPADDKMGPLVDEACGIAEVARKGASDLEKSVDGIKTYFFKDGVQLVVDGMGPDEVVEIMETRIEFREKREKLREKGKNITGLSLSDTLKNYAQTGSEYTKILNQIIMQNNLDDFEPVRLVNSIKQVELNS